jgi:hypothetical protein
VAILNIAARRYVTTPTPAGTKHGSTIGENEALLNIRPLHAQPYVTYWHATATALLVGG